MTHVFAYLVIASSVHGGSSWNVTLCLIWMFVISSAKVLLNPGDLTLISLGQAWFAVLR